MIQRGVLLIEYPKDLNQSELKKELESRGCRVETLAVFLQLFKNAQFPDTFKFDEEKGGRFGIKI